MDIQVESIGDSRIVHIEGKITFEYCSVLQNRLDAAVDDTVREVVIDFQSVPFIDSSGVGEILRLYKRMRENNGEVVLANPNQKLRDLFAMYRFGQFMKIRTDSDPN
jgi:stage II sporulation protein AA (anti-sigma F factor antagonist)